MNSIKSIEKAINLSVDESAKTISCNLVTGGCINAAYKATTKKGNYFIKINRKENLDMFFKEKAGLQLLQSTNSIKIPQVLGVGEVDEIAYLILEWIEPKQKKKDYWQQFGIKLAKLHSNTNLTFGWSKDNYIGSLSQSNTPKSTWYDFFFECRLEPQFNLAIKNNSIGIDYLKKLEVLKKKSESFFPEEKPALLHGDLWSGNLITDNLGEPCLIDPAVYFGHREAELAFTQLFGGFDNSFFNAYETISPLEKDFSSRVKVYNLYPLMIHVNLFGKSYLAGVDRVLKKYC